MDLYDIWFDNPSYWFKSSNNDNHFLASKFNDWIDMYHNCEINIRNCLSSIILFDQITRNLQIKTKEYDDIAMYYVLKLKDISNNFKDLTAKEWCFAMLPYRHTYNVCEIHIVIINAWKRLLNSSNNEDIIMYKKFIKASYERCPTNNINFIKCIDPSNYDDREWNSDLHINVLEYAVNGCTIPSYKIDLSYNPMNVDKITKSFQTILNVLKTNTIIISLSGGVDSMISSIILKRLQIIYNLEIIAVHINYANRKSCDDEVDMLKDWCNYLNIKLYIRKINEINRPLCMEYEMRNIYEKYTREVRYNVYKNVWNVNLMIDEEPIVFLGHNQDDKIENILTNIAQQGKYELLDGMKYIQTVDQISFVRPMLDITKDEIYNFSRVNHIPHLPNSTPSWSMRGKIRDVVRPALIEWHSTILQSLMTLSDVVKDLNDLLDIQVNTIINKTKIYENKYVYEISFDEIDNLPSQPIFWQNYINKLLNQQISLRSSIYLKEKIEKLKETFKINCNRSLVQLSKNIGILIKSNKNDKIIYITIFTNELS